MIGAADSSQVTQLSIIFANEYEDASQPFAVLNVVKLVAMAVIVGIGAYLRDKEAFRIFFIVALVMNVGAQMVVLWGYEFKEIRTKESKVIEMEGKDKLISEE